MGPSRSTSTARRYRCALARPQAQWAHREFGLHFDSASHAVASHRAARGHHRRRGPLPCRVNRRGHGLPSSTSRCNGPPGRALRADRRSRAPWTVVADLSLRLRVLRRCGARRRRVEHQLWRRARQHGPRSARRELVAGRACARQRVRLVDELYEKRPRPRPSHSRSSAGRLWAEVRAAV